jgi:hypothetical protein
MALVAAHHHQMAAEHQNYENKNRKAVTHTKSRQDKNQKNGKDTTYYHP